MIEHRIVACHETISPLTNRPVLEVEAMGVDAIKRRFQAPVPGIGSPIRVGATFSYNPQSHHVMGLPLEIADYNRYGVSLE